MTFPDEDFFIDLKLEEQKLKQKDYEENEPWLDEPRLRVLLLN